MTNRLVQHITVEESPVNNGLGTRAALGMETLAYQTFDSYCNLQLNHYITIKVIQNV